jgi:hypothetical protein
MNILKLSLITALVPLGMLNSRLDAQMIAGNARLGKAAYESLNVAGALDFNNLTIEKNLTVAGSANGNSLKCNKFTVNGSFTGKNIQAQNGEVNGALACDKVTIDDDLIVNGSLSGKEIKVSGKTQIFGGLDASESSFGDIEIATTKGTLTNSKAKNIIVKETQDLSQRLYLEGKTIIEENITFESGNGKVFISDGAQVMGAIQGASVVRQ